MAPHSTQFASTSETSGVPKRVVQATVFQILGRFWGTACSLALLYVLGQALADEDFGTFTFYLAIFNWLDALTMMGTGRVAVQRTAASPERIPAVLKAARRIRWQAACVGIVIVGGGALAFGESGALWILAASAYPLSHVLDLSVTVLRNRIRWGIPVAVRAGMSTLGLLLIVLLHHFEIEEPGPYLMAIAVSSVVGNFVLHAFCRGSLPKVRGPVVAEPGLLRASLPLGLASLCAISYFYLDNLFIRAFEGEKALGPYNVAVRFLSFFIMVAQFSTLSAIPWLARRAEALDLGRAVQRMGPPMFLAAGVGAGILWPFADELLELFHADYSVAAPSMRWLLLAVMGIFASAVLQTSLVAVGRTGAVLISSITGLAVNVVGNAWAVPRYGVEGAAGATFATEVTVAVLAFAQLRDHRSAGPPVRILPWIAGPIGFLVTWGLGLLIAAA